MMTSRAIGRYLGAAALVVVLTGCGDGDSTATESTGSTGEESVESSADGDAARTGGNGDEKDSGNESDADSGGAGSEDGEPGAAPGVYKDYSADAIADTSYETTILFFHASWCVECRAFEEAIHDQGVPDGVQILKTDYDSEQDLKEKYGVTIQSSFVKVGPDGEELSKWFGYGEDKSVETILEQLG